jgi:hypothetical protein
MTDLMDHDGFYDYNTGGAAIHKDEDEFSSEDNAIETSDFFAGGAKTANERSFTVVNASIGSFEGGRFIATSAYNAAKKAATAVFRHIDVESGVAKPRKQAPATKNVKDVAVNKALASKFKKTPASEVEIVLYRTDRQNAHKYYAYTAYRERAPTPLKIKRTVNKGTSNEKTVTVSFNFTINVKPAKLADEYVEKNAQLSKDFNAAKRAAKRRAENGGKEPKERKPRAAKAAKAPKAPKAAAAKAEKKPKDAVAKGEKKGKKITIADIIKSLSVRPPPAKPEKAPKAKAKAPRKALADKAEKKPKAAAAKKSKTAAKKANDFFGGGGQCSFF